MKDEWPLVDGLTETSQDGTSLPARLMACLAKRPGGAVPELHRAVSALEDAFGKEENPKLRARIAAARSILLDGPTKAED